MTRPSTTKFANGRGQISEDTATRRNDSDSKGHKRPGIKLNLKKEKRQFQMH